MTHKDARKTYFIVFGLLVALTITTVGVSMVELGIFHVTAALLIAFIKASLVVLYFMHVKESSGLTKVYVGGGLVWLAIMISYTFGDYLTRDSLPTPQRSLSHQGAEQRQMVPTK